MAARVLPFLSVLLLWPALGARAQGEGTELRQVAGILDYIGSDYAGAVGPGGVIENELEYREQFSLTADALALAKEAGLRDEDPVVRGLEALIPMLERRAPPREVLAHCRAIRDSLVQTHQVALEPTGVPNAARAQELYVAHACNTCHGDDGGADTELARTMDPPPASFLDRERVAGVSPHRAFYAISHGVDGTGMTGYPALSEQDRWSLAFWVLSMRHGEGDLAKGQRVLERSGVAMDASARRLSQLTDDDLRQELSATLAAEADVEAALAFLRSAAPFRAPGADGSFALARAKILEGVEAYRRGDASEARSAFISAYLDGFEPQEPALRSRESGLVNEIESAMLALREGASRGLPITEVEERAAVVAGLLDQAEQSRGSLTTAFIGAAAISLREGFEAVLLIAALLALVRRRGSSEQARWVHAGWLAALPAGFVTWLLAGKLLGGLERELAEGIVALAAAVVLLGVTHWIVGQATAKSFLGAVADKLGTASQKGTRLGVFALAFVAVYREAFEVVLFYQALLLDAGNGWVVLGGAATGLAILAVLALGLRRVGQRLAPRPFMLASGAVLALLALMLVGKGVRAFQEAGVFATTVVSFPDLPMLGVFGTAEGLTAQAVLALLLLGSAAWPWLLSRRQRDGSDATPAE